MNRIVLFICLIFLVSLTGCVYFGFQGRIEPGYTPTYYVAPNGHGVGVYEYDPGEMMIAVITRDGKIRRLVSHVENIIGGRNLCVIPAAVDGKVPERVEVLVNGKILKNVKRERIHGILRWKFKLSSRNDRSTSIVEVRVYYRDQYPVIKPGPASGYVDSGGFQVYNCFDKYDPRCRFEWGP